ncbi:uncharacterized protein CTRU02_209768 [Colletotrichum truncatum]|uniref:Uncharacterized protein n=1 Tax=Colletotrichum truncatum TaxID=5467 RepID=A0ACC3YVK6_COLTU|nr:uncharacterized protein CTRU02_02341 [Colletotrichum truncatum]KAF6798367.1 hypothetical protein CTRU02_02341 [Colletotrichum truncatum]
MLDLPDHVWSLVFSQLEYPIREATFSSECQWSEPDTSGLTTLSRLCQTSSRFLRLARRVLYRSLPLDNWRIHKRLLSTLHQHSYLTEYVENVVLGEGVFSRDEMASLLQPYYSKTLQQPSSKPGSLEAALREFLDGPEWPEGGPDIWFTHCANLLPNLKLLQYATRSFDELFPAIIRQAAEPEPKELVPLSKIVEFRISNQDTELAVRLQYIQELFLLPQLEIFRGCAVDLNTTLAAPGQTPEQQPRQSNSLRHAYFTDSLAEADGICDILRTCPSLQTFSMTWGSATVGDSYLNFDLIGKALREHGTSLEVLVLNCQECLWYDIGETQGKLGDLQALKHLKHLSLPEAILLGSEDELSGMDKVGDDEEDEDGEDPITADSLEPLLPESLESLRFYSCYDEEAWVRNSIQGVLSSERLNRLKKLQLDDAADTGIEWDLTGWQSKKVSGHLILSR